ncbi:DUF1194 domain-containing protein [Azospirillaceae bacterium]
MMTYRFFDFSKEWSRHYRNAFKKAQFPVLISASLILTLLTNATRAAEPRAVDLALVLMVDASASISDGDLEFELRGHAAAFRDEAVIRIITGGRRRAIAVTFASFSGPNSFTVRTPWRVISNAAEAIAFSDAILASPRAIQAGSTALGSALTEAQTLFRSSGVRADRLAIDIVSNGFNNSGLPPEPARDIAIAAGISINALAILDEYEWLESYYADFVIGGSGAFVISAENRASFSQAIRRKLIQEIAALP